MLVCALLAAAGSHADETGTEISAETLLEYRVKAAFLFNFAKFVSWPDHALERQSAIRICVVEDDAFVDVLDETIVGKSVRGRGLSVSRLDLRQTEEIERCHLLYAGERLKDDLEALIEPLARRPILTVGDAEGFARRGCVVNFYEAGNKVRFEINAEAADRAGLKISSKLLGLARIVTDE